MEHVGKRLFVHTLNIGKRIELTDPALLQVAKGADIFLDTATRFMTGDENAAADQRVFGENLFALLAAGARTVTGLHHAGKAFRSANDITLENILRGSSDLGAILGVCWGILQLDAESNLIHVKNAKARDFQADRPFEIEGRPHIDQTGKFKLVARPGMAASIVPRRVERAAGLRLSTATSSWQRCSNFTRRVRSCGRLKTLLASTGTRSASSFLTRN